MSEIALFKGAAVPGFVKKAEVSALAKSLAGGSGQSGKRISIKGGVFRLINDGKEVAQIDDRHMHVVIVNAAPKVGRIFFAKKWDGDATTPPDCWSSDGNTPDSDVPAKQHANCADCPQNVKGSGANESKACRYQQSVALVPVFDDELSEDVMKLVLPALSLFGKEENGNFPLQAYARHLAAQNINPDMVVTRMRFDTKAESPKLFFKPMRWLTEEEYERAQEMGQSEDAIKAITMSVNLDAVKAPAADDTLPGKRPGKAKPAPVDDDEEDEALAPKAKAKAKPAPADDDDEDEAPAPKAKAKAKPAPADDDDEDEAPAPKAKAKAKPAPADDDDDDEDEPKVRKPAPAPAAKADPKSTLANLASKWDDEED